MKGSVRADEHRAVRVALFLNEDFAMYQFRRSLICGLVDAGADVFVLTPPGPYVEKLEALGIRHVPIDVYRFVSPIRDLVLCFRLRRIFRQIRPDIVHNMTVKPNIYGSIAARLARVPRVVGLVSGMGYGLVGGRALRERSLQRVVRGLYRLGCRLMDRVWFQNGDDLGAFVDLGLIDRDRAVLIRSGGIDLDEYSADVYDELSLTAIRSSLGVPAASVLVVMMVARLTWSKGVREFVEASSRVRNAHPDARFLLVGPLDPNSPDAVPEVYLHEHASDCAWLGFRTDGKDILAAADVVALPSFYPEGVPRVMLEALALGKPVVTTDSVGCREVIDDGVNGFMVPVRDSDAVTEAIERLVADRPMREQFGDKSRAKAVAEFDSRIVVERILTEVYGFPARESRG